MQFTADEFCERLWLQENGLCLQELTTALYEQLTEANNERRLCGHLLMLGVDIDETLIQRSTECNRHAENIFYRTADIQSNDCRRGVIGEFLGNYGTEKFSVVFINSITMWIHLNCGDDGLHDFLQYVSSIAEYILIEPQDWKCYKTAVRRMKKLGCEPFEHFPALQWRDDVSQQILDYLQSDACGLEFVKDFGRTESWNRSLCLLTSLQK